MDTTHLVFHEMSVKKEEYQWRPFPLSFQDNIRGKGKIKEAEELSRRNGTLIKNHESAASRRTRPASRIRTLKYDLTRGMLSVVRN